MAETATKQTGTVAWFNKTKGYGFIKPEGGGKDVFVHITAVQAAGLQGLEENDRVSFAVGRDQQGKLSASELAVLR
jgi:CspA family cold shock protein